MSPKLMFEIVWLSVGMAGLILTIWAFRHLVEKDAMTQVRAILPDWPFHPTLYDDFGAKLCRAGRFLFWTAIGFAVLYFVIYYR